MKQNTTYKQTELGLIPEDWEVKKLGKVGEIDKKSLNSNTDKEYEFDYISLSDVDSDQFSIKTSKQKFKNAPSRARRIVKKGDVLLSTVRPNLEGFTIIRDEVKDLIASTGFAVITSKNELHNEYLFNFLFSNIIKRQFHKLLVGSNYPAINSSDVKNLKIPLPPLLEQKKIADCLSTWDSAIEKQSQLINALTPRKKALMQQLLTGKKRLPGFSGEWKEVKLGEIGEIQTGNTPSKLESENWNGEYYWCTAEDMKSKYVNNTAQKLTKKGWSLARTVKANSILVTCIASIGINAITNVECSFNQQINSITPNENFSTEFIYYLMNNSKENLLKYAGAGALPMLNKNTFSSIKFKFPTLSEQTAIAEILATADRELTLQKEKLAQLQQQKKGLMQVLLTGKKRLIN